MIENSGNVRQSAIPVTVDNRPPTIALTNPANGRSYVMEDDEWVNMNAVATDDWSLDRVVFYVDESPVFTTTVAPYGAKWTIKMVDRIPAEVRTTEVITNLTVP